MKFKSGIYHRKSIRLVGYDYSWVGYYFITICVKNGENLFGEIKNGKMVLSAFGHLTKRQWRQISKIRKHIALDAFVVMPNHFHGIIIIVKNLTVIGRVRVGAIHESPLHASPLHRDKRRQMVLSKIIGKFKMQTAKQINQLDNTPGLKIWQRNYYEHIIRDETELNRIRGYIKNNPINWPTDHNNPIT